MGNTQVPISVEQVATVTSEAQHLLNGAGFDPDGDISGEDWKKVFAFLDTNGDKVVSRKEWCLQLGTTELFDCITKKTLGNISLTEWHQAFLALDCHQTGKISAKMWQSRQKLDLLTLSLGLGRNHWGVQIGDKIFEVPPPGEGQTGSEMAVLGPEGVVGLGGELQSNRQGWLELMLKYSQDGVRAQGSWSESRSEPTSLPLDSWTGVEHVGWTSKTDEEIQKFLQGWLLEHPTYLGFHALGKETNNQTFVLDFITFLSGEAYTKWTDGSKGRALAVGGALLLGGIAAFAVYRSQKKDDSASPSDGPKSIGSPPKK